MQLRFEKSITSFSFRQKTGFTLIELMVSVMAILVLTGLLIAGYSNFNNAQTVKQSALTLKNNLTQVRTLAASGKKPTGCDTLVGYQVDFPGIQAYRVQPVCIVAGVQTTVGTGTSYTLPVSVEFSSLPSPILFRGVNGGATAATISLEGNGTTATVSVSSSGIVSY